MKVPPPLLSAIRHARSGIFGNSVFGPLFFHVGIPVLVLLPWLGLAAWEAIQGMTDGMVNPAGNATISWALPRFEAWSIFLFWALFVFSWVDQLTRMGPEQDKLRRYYSEVGLFFLTSAALSLVVFLGSFIHTNHGVWGAEDAESKFRYGPLVFCLSFYALWTLVFLVPWLIGRQFRYHLGWARLRVFGVYSWAFMLAHPVTAALLGIAGTVSLGLLVATVNADAAKVVSPVIQELGMSQILLVGSVVLTSSLQLFLVLYKDFGDIDRMALASYTKRAISKMSGHVVISGFGRVGEEMARGSAHRFRKGTGGDNPVPFVKRGFIPLVSAHWRRWHPNPSNVQIKSLLFLPQLLVVDQDPDKFIGLYESRQGLKYGIGFMKMPGWGCHLAVEGATGVYSRDTRQEVAEAFPVPPDPFVAFIAIVGDVTSRAVQSACRLSSAKYLINTIGDPVVSRRLLGQYRYSMPEDDRQPNGRRPILITMHHIEEEEPFVLNNAQGSGAVSILPHQVISRAFAHKLFYAILSQEKHLFPDDGSTGGDIKLFVAGSGSKRMLVQLWALLGRIEHGKAMSILRRITLLIYGERSLPTQMIGDKEVLCISRGGIPWEPDKEAEKHSFPCVRVSDHPAAFDLALFEGEEVQPTRVLGIFCPDDPVTTRAVLHEASLAVRRCCLIHAEGSVRVEGPPIVAVGSGIERRDVEERLMYYDEVMVNRLNASYPLGYVDVNRELWTAVNGVIGNEGGI